MTIEKKAYRREVLLKYLTHPLTVVPAAIGATGLLLGWAFGSGLLAFGGLGLLAITGGLLVTRLISSNTAIEEKVLERLQDEERKQRKDSLDDLAKKLEKDDDDRDEEALDDLRQLVKAFHEDRSWEASVDPGTAIELLNGVDRLFRSSEQTLRDSLELRQKAKKASSKVRKSFMKRRDVLIEDVEASVDRLRHLFEELQTMRPLHDSGEDLRSIREELDSSLEMAKQISEKVSEWEALADDYRDYE